MPQGNDPTLGINSWLEDELYQQYQFDRKSLDEGWTHLFEKSGPNGEGHVFPNGDAAEPSTSAVAVAPEEAPPVQEPPPAPVPKQEPPEPPAAPQEPPSPQQQTDLARTTAP